MSKHIESVLFILTIFMLLDFQYVNGNMSKYGGKYLKYFYSVQQEIHSYSLQ